jgi:hypothetical protein
MGSYCRTYGKGFYIYIGSVQRIAEGRGEPYRLLSNMISLQADEAER